MFAVEYKTRKPRPAVIVDPPEVVAKAGTKEIAFAHQFLDGASGEPHANGRLNAALAALIDALFRPLTAQIKMGIGDLDRRKKVRDLIRNTFNGMSARQDDEVTVAFWASRNSPRIIISHRNRWWVDLKPTLQWEVAILQLFPATLESLEAPHRHYDRHLDSPCHNVLEACEED